MGVVSRHPQACDRARQWASLELDGELSELEAFSLRAHLDRCADCAAVVGDIRRITGRVRDAALERPAAHVTLPQRRRPRVRAFQIAVAAATIAVGVSLGSLAGSLSNHRGATTAAAGSQPPGFSQALVAMLQSNAPAHGQHFQIPI